MSQTIKRTKFRIKDVIDNNLQNQEHSAQKTIQSSYIRQNVLDFDQLKKTLEERKLTFIKFAFQQQELIEDRNLGPVLQGICRNQNVGSMSVSELIPKQQIRTYLMQAQQEKPKRVLKRFAHWEWDGENGHSKMMNHQFTQRHEVEILARLENRGGEKMLRQRIINKWSKHLPTLSGLHEFGKQFTKEKTEVQSLPVSLSPKCRNESCHQIKNWLLELDELKNDNEIVKRKLEKALDSLQRK